MNNTFCLPTTALLNAANSSHLYTIPVEWEYDWVGDWIDPRNGTAPNIKRVTRLRCICGEEIDLRSPTLPTAETETR